MLHHSIHRQMYNFDVTIKLHTTLQAAESELWKTDLHHCFKPAEVGQVSFTHFTEVVTKKLYKGVSEVITVPHQ